MKKFVSGLLVASYLALSVCALQPAQAASATGSATAEIVSPICLMGVNGGVLKFGQIVPGTGGTICVAPDNSRHNSNGVQVVSTSSFAAAQFQVNGAANAAISIAIPQTLTINNGVNSMLVDGLTSMPYGTGMLDANGRCNIFVGGTLHVRPNQALGVYSGNFTITVAYN